MKIKLSFLFSVIFFINISFSFAQNVVKEGKLTIIMSFPDADAEMASALKSVLGGPVMYFKNGSIRSEIKTANGSMITIINVKKNITYDLINMGGMKYAMKVDSTQKDSLKKEALKIDSTKKNFFNVFHPDIKLTNDTKRILGYDCKKAVVTYEIDGKKRDFDWWYTKEIDASNYKSINIEFTGIDGFIMDMTTPFKTMDKEMIINTSVTSITPMPVSDTMFELPADYPLKSIGDLKEQFKGKSASVSNQSNQSIVSPPGSVFPEITMTNVNGDTVKLSSLRGKYVLVDFWASWCGPCRAENPNVVAAYKKYKDKGFTVYSVSLDSDKAKWQAAIAKDNLTWASHVCDYMGWMSPVCRQFNINGIPCNYLLDKEGKVLAVNLRGDELEKALEQYLK